MSKNGSGVVPIGPAKSGAKASWYDMREFIAFLEKKANSRA